MIWGVDMLPDTYTPDTDPSDAGGSCYGLTQGATGEFDHYFRTVATNIVKARLPDLGHPARLGVQRRLVPLGGPGMRVRLRPLLRRHRHHDALGARVALHLRVEPDPRGPGRRRPGQLLPG